jgi:uncharacterized protein
VAWDGEDGATSARLEWPATLDLAAELSRGWQPVPFRQFILKLHSRCNLACSYCYVYELADQTWRTRPRTMSSAIVSVVARRIAEHARAHDLDAVRIIFHGGEPLLTGPEPLIEALRKIRSEVDARVRVDSWVQTNGTLLGEETLDVLEAHGIRVGISLDGQADGHDRNRQYANGRGSHDQVSTALHRLMKRPSIYSGLLSVVDLLADPVATYEALLRFAPPAIDFLLPHANWSAPPPGRTGSTPAPYSEWLMAAFDRWYDAPIRETRVRLFEEIVHLLLGGASASESVGLTPTTLVVIESDGSIEQSDALKSAYHAAAATGLHVVQDSFDAALKLPQVAATQLGWRALAEECLACPVHHVCGAGLYAHRYKVGAGFQNRSVYCPDLYALITHIRTRVRADLAAQLPRSEGSM